MVMFRCYDRPPYALNMLAMFGIPVWATFVLPTAAVAMIVLWAGAPRLRRDSGFRLLLIFSVSLAAIEVMVLGLLFGVLVLFSLSGGMENF